MHTPEEFCKYDIFDQRGQLNLERGPPTVSKNNFDKNSMEKQRNRTEKNKSLRTEFEPVSRYIHALKPLSYMRTILSRTLFLFYYSIF